MNIKKLSQASSNIGYAMGVLEGCVLIAESESAKACISSAIDGLALIDLMEMCEPGTQDSKETKDV